MLIEPSHPVEGLQVSDLRAGLSFSFSFLVRADTGQAKADGGTPFNSICHATPSKTVIIIIIFSFELIRCFGWKPTSSSFILLGHAWPVALVLVVGCFQVGVLVEKGFKRLPVVFELFVLFATFSFSRFIRFLLLLIS